MKDPSGGWYWLGIFLNCVHLLISIVLVLGGWLFPHKYLFLVISANLMLLFRYHDYCFVSEITQLVKNKQAGCESDFIFSDDAQSVYKDYLGIEMSTHAIGTMTTTLFMLSSGIALLRLGVKYNFPILPTNGTILFAIGFMAMWVAVEVYMAFFYQSMPKCVDVHEEEEIGEEMSPWTQFTL